MKKDELIHMWKEGSEQLFGDKKTDRDMIEKYISEKTLKGNWSMHFNLVFYGAIQVANIILLSINLAGYQNNTALIWVLISQLLVSIGILVFSMDLFYKFREINNFSDSLQTLIRKQLRFYRRPYEIWLFLAAVSAIILMSNLNLYVDNDNGTYVIYNKAKFVVIALAAFAFIYGTLKVSSLFGLRRLKAYLADLQQGALERSKEMERSRRRLLWLWVLIFILLTVILIFGILKAVS